MPRQSSCGTSAPVLYEALRGQTGAEVDSIKDNKGSLALIIMQVEREFREVDEKATFKKTVIEEAFVQFDKGRQKMFSMAAKLTSEKWGEKARKEIRAELDKVNKRMNSQKARDEAKSVQSEASGGPTPVGHDQAGASSKVSESQIPSVRPFQPLPVMSQAPSQQSPTKLIQVPAEVDESVIAAAIAAAMRLRIVKVGIVSVSAPSGSKAAIEAPRVEEEDLELEGDEDRDESDDEGDELSDADAPAKRPACGAFVRKFLLKRPAASAGDAAPVPKATKVDAADPASDRRVLASGWVVRTHYRASDAQKGNQKYRTYMSPTKVVFKSLVQASTAGFRDE